MGKKFMIVKPMPCCGFSKLIGKVYEAAPNLGYTNETRCYACNMQYKLKKPIYTFSKGLIAIVDESIIVWLPDEQDVLDHDEQLKVEA